MENAVKLGNARKCDLAMLEDRILVKQGKEQRYGTQLIYNENERQYSLEPLANPKTVEDRRESVGLPSMNEYLALYGLSWENGNAKTK